MHQNAIKSTNRCECIGIANINIQIVGGVHISLILRLLQSKEKRLDIRLININIMVIW